MYLLPVRKNIRMPRLNYVGYQCYFVTLCTFGRQNIFSDSNHCLLKSFKIKSSRKCAAREGRTLWQKGFYEHILRPGESVESVAWYIWLNPVRKGMVSRAQDYPFSGSLAGMKMPSSWDAPGWRPPWK